ncbi:MAG: alpha/beta hydrolase fold domain-containing protein [Muribaculaceae bacterium]|nr:alpha/beta hydrolase fold domain-containing protein [Muribaculaceae bacterium]
MRLSTTLKAFAIGCGLLAAATAGAQSNKVPTNRYAMKMDQNADGTYSLQQQKKYERLPDVDLSKIPDLLVPFTYTADRLKSKDYKGVRTEDIIFKHGPGYDLKITVDFSDDTENPSPVMFYIHGGGWSRGDNSSSKTLSQYMAKQHGVTGVRVEYVLAGQPDATVEVSVQDVLDAYKYVMDHAKELNVDPQRFGFLGTSAGSHLAAVAAMKTPGTKAMVGYSGIYDLTKAAIVQRTKDQQRIDYFKGRDDKVLRNNSGIFLIPSKKEEIPAVMLVCGTADVTVEYDQSTSFADALRKAGGDVRLDVYENYDHNLSSKVSDVMEEIFFNTADFLNDKLATTYRPAPQEKKRAQAPAPAAPQSQPQASAASGITTTSTASAEEDLAKMGIHSECPNNSRQHADNPVPHIVKTYDPDLKKDVYSFLMHAKIDDDRGKSNITDRQRNEVKTDNKSPKELWATEGETMTFRWKMKLPEGFKTTERFSHVHQLKGIDNKEKNAEVGNPLMSLTCYSTKKGGQELRVRYYDRTKGDQAETVAKVDLDKLKGRWVEIEETAKFAADGAYSITIKDAKTGEVLLQFSDDNLDMWRTGAAGLRPKWGLYRWLGKNREAENQLRDEEIRFADFEIIKQ